MANKSLLEQMLERLVNEDQAKAEELFHEYVVAKSREIYEGLIESELAETDDADADDEEEVEESADADADDEEDLDEEFEDIAFEADDEMGGDPTDDLAGELDGEGEEGEDDLEEKDPGELFQDLGAIVDELQAKFDAMGGDMGADEGEMGGMDDEMKDDFDLETVREYVEKVGTDWDKNGLRKEGEYSGTGTQSDSININSKSIVAGKNDMGGTTANIAKGGTENSPVEANKGQLKGNGLLKGNVVPNPDAKGNVNVPGGNAGKTAFKTKEAGHGAEKKGEAEGKFSGAGGSAGSVEKASLFRGRR